MTRHNLNAADLTAARRAALAIDLLAVAASLAANIAASRQTLAGWMVSAIAPIGLFLAIILWHRSHGVVVGWLGRAFTAGLGAIALGAAWISYGHLRHVALAAGQSETASAIIPLVIDGAAILATIVVISAGQRLTELAVAEAEAVETARHERDESAAAERAAARKAEADQVEADRQATAELERQKIEADARIELARIAAETEAAETAARQQRLATARQPASAPSAIGPGGRASKPPPAKTTPKADTSQLIADYLAEHPDAKQAEVATAAGCTTKTVQRNQAWRDHQEAKQEAA